jgi:hypothetical protein
VKLVKKLKDKESNMVFITLLKKFEDYPLFVISFNSPFWLPNVRKSFITPSNGTIRKPREDAYYFPIRFDDWSAIFVDESPNPGVFSTENDDKRDD